jgi:hypothetical protein
MAVLMLAWPNSVCRAFGCIPLSWCSLYQNCTNLILLALLKLQYRFG